MMQGLLIKNQDGGVVIDGVHPSYGLARSGAFTLPWHSYFSLYFGEAISGPVLSGTEILAVRPASAAHIAPISVDNKQKYLSNVSTVEYVVLDLIKNLTPSEQNGIAVFNSAGETMWSSTSPIAFVNDALLLPSAFASVQAYDQTFAGDYAMVAGSTVQAAFSSPRIDYLAVERKPDDSLRAYWHQNTQNGGFSGGSVYYIGSTSMNILGVSA